MMKAKVKSVIALLRMNLKIVMKVKVNRVIGLEVKNRVDVV